MRAWKSLLVYPFSHFTTILCRNLNNSLTLTWSLTIALASLARKPLCENERLLDNAVIPDALSTLKSSYWKDFCLLRKWAEKMRSLESSFTKLAGYRIRAMFLLEMRKLQQRCKDRKQQKCKRDLRYLRPSLNKDLYTYYLETIFKQVIGTTILFKETSLEI